MLSFSFEKLNWQKWLLVHFKINRLPEKHIVGRYLETLTIFDVQNDNEGLDFFIPPSFLDTSKSLPEPYCNGYIGIVIGAKHATKQLPVEQLILLCKKISHPVVLLGGFEDKEIGEQVLQNSSTQVFNACGMFNLLQSAALVKDAKLIISHDTGLMHIAAAFKKNILSIWGNTVPQFGMYPYMPANQQQIFEVNNLPCRPCSKIGYKHCPKKHFSCMKLQDVTAIAQKANEIFEEN